MSINIQLAASRVHLLWYDLLSVAAIELQPNGFVRKPVLYQIKYSKFDHIFRINNDIDDMVEYMQCKHESYACEQLTACTWAVAVKN